MNREELKKKVRVTAETLLYEKGYVSPVDLLMKMDKLTPKAHEDWRFGRIPYLERVCSGNLSKLSTIMTELQIFAKESNLKPSKTYYKKWGKGKSTQLRFSKTGNPQIEEAYATHYVDMSKKKESSTKES